MKKPDKAEIKSKQTYDRLAANYDDTFDGKFTVKFKQIILENIEVSNNDTILDVGCENGQLLNMISKKYHNLQLNTIGCDLSSTMIEVATELYPNSTFYNCSCENISVADNTIDTITVCAAFHHFPNINDFMQEANRILKVGGKLYIAEIYLPSFINFFVNPFLKYSKAGDVKFYASQELIEPFNQHGFKFIRVIKNKYIQLIEFEKKS